MTHIILLLFKHNILNPLFIIELIGRKDNVHNCRGVFAAYI